MGGSRALAVVGVLIFGCASRGAPLEGGDGSEATSSVSGTTGASTGGRATSTSDRGSTSDTEGEVSTSSTGPGGADDSATSGSPWCTGYECGRRGGCSENERCVYRWGGGEPGQGSSVCRPVAPLPKQQGEECTWSPDRCDDDCAAGLTCWATEPATGTGYCVAWCIPDECAPGFSCLGSDNGNLPEVCAPNCDPLNPSCPSPVEGCFYWSGWQSGFVCRPVFPPDRPPEHGEPCTWLGGYTYECAPQHYCPETNSLCRRYCDPADSMSCADVGTECLRDIDLGTQTVGLCAL